LSDTSSVRNRHAGLLRHIACTTIDIDDNVLRAAKELARREKTTAALTTRPEAATVEECSPNISSATNNDCGGSATGWTMSPGRRR
jgi:hypothetical protein